MQRFDFTGATAVVTGAASGIGAALAHALGHRGSDLVLLDRDAERLDAVTAAIRAEHPDRQLATYLVDLADQTATAQVAAEIGQRHPPGTPLNRGVVRPAPPAPGVPAQRPAADAVDAAREVA